MTDAKLKRQADSPQSGYVIETVVVPIAETVEVLDHFRDWHPHVFVGAQFFSDELGTTPVVPSGGEVYFNLKPLTTNQYEPFPQEVIQADTPETVSAASPPLAGIKVTPMSVTGATHWRIVIATYSQR